MLGAIPCRLCHAGGLLSTLSCSFEFRAGTTLHAVHSVVARVCWSRLLASPAKGGSINSSTRNCGTTNTMCQMSAVDCGRCFANLHSLISCINSKKPCAQQEPVVTQPAGNCVVVAFFRAENNMTYLAVTAHYGHATLPQLGVPREACGQTVLAG